jgi:hypothetical protein
MLQYGVSILVSVLMGLGVSCGFSFKACIAQETGGTFSFHTYVHMYDPVNAATYDMNCSGEGPGTFHDPDPPNPQKVDLQDYVLWFNKY